MLNTSLHNYDFSFKLQGLNPLTSSHQQIYQLDWVVYLNALDSVKYITKSPTILYQNNNDH